MTTKMNSSARRTVSMLLIMFCLLSFAAATAAAQTSAFTYQGHFSDTSVASQPTSGTYSMTFRLYDAASGGNQIGSAITAASVTVTNGIFTVPLDFGATAFNTTGARYLEIQIGSTTLTPRQEVTSAPFARKATNAGAADALSNACAGCVTDSQINAVSGSKVTGTVASASFATTANSANTATNANSAATANTATNAQQLGGVAASGYLQTGGNGANVTNLNASNLASGTVPVARLGTNTPSATTYLRGDNTWQPVSGGGGATLQLVATSTTGQSVPVGTSASPSTATISFNNTVTSPSSGSFNGTTFTAGTAGTYLIIVNFTGSTSAALFPTILQNNSPIAHGAAAASTNLSQPVSRANVSMVTVLAAGDTIIVQGSNGNSANAATLTTDGTTRLIITRLN